jgi:hypothetical protein
MHHEFDTSRGEELLIEMRYQEWRARREMESVFTDGGLTADTTADNVSREPAVPILAPPYSS